MQLLPEVSMYTICCISTSIMVRFILMGIRLDGKAAATGSPASCWEAYEEDEAGLQDSPQGW